MSITEEEIAMCEWFLFMPQVRCEVADVVDRAVVAEASGFDGIALIDHLVTPMGPTQTIWEAMTLATWVAARTSTLRIGPLVLCNAFRHPAVLAKQVVTLDHASGGRFELGLGAGSVPDELVAFDVSSASDGQRIDGLRRSLDTLRELLDPASEAVAQQFPKPVGRIPVVIGGAGPRTLDIVAEYADWWNLPAPDIERLPELRPRIGRARVSVQQMVSFARRGADAEDVHASARRRFGRMGAGLVAGDADGLAAHFRGLSEQGVERFYVWFADSAQPDSIREFAESVIPQVRAPS